MHAIYMFFVYMHFLLYMYMYMYVYMHFTTKRLGDKTCSGNLLQECVKGCAVHGIASYWSTILVIFPNNVCVCVCKSLDPGIIIVLHVNMHAPHPYRTAAVY
jgi:hypothetical protein